MAANLLTDSTIPKESAGIFGMVCGLCEVSFGGGIVAVAASSFPVYSKLKPVPVLKAELPKPMASDLSPDRSIFHDASSSNPRRDLVFVVNPRGANGRTGKDWKKLLPYLRSRLDKNCNAIWEGADAVVAVGGDGTLHEVVNGFFWAGKPVANHNKEATRSTALGVAGKPVANHNKEATRSTALGVSVAILFLYLFISCYVVMFDYMFTFSITAKLSFQFHGVDFSRKNDPREAIDRIAKGLRSPVDVGVITGESEEESHYFINVASIHLSAKAGYFASRYKRFGNLCYVIGALQAFMGHKNQDLRIKASLVNEGEWETCSLVTALCIGNAKYFGGGMKITPNADPSSGNFEVVILRDFKWYDFILKLHRLYNGTHLSVKNVASISVFSIEVEDISGGGSIDVESDGEHLGFLPRKFCILPSTIEMICWHESTRTIQLVT
ncbi:hypothetical protein POTOM_010515 [Populus tomentosa]|uniref:DAGKc domain-containing protein n=1 Tax=Populus tomentosa TaxID=118781 RepID=A0A8X8D2C3_POPTO|nr:hypothetical protein POTOM_010515 [Populus tomentosa]